MSCFDEHPGCVFSNLAGLAAHNSGEGNYPGSICYHQVELRQLAVNAVERPQRLTRFGPPDDDLFTSDAVQIESVEGLAHFQEHIIGDVHDVVDGPHSGRAEAELHPQRARRHGHVPNLPAYIPRTAPWVIEGHFHAARRVPLRPTKRSALEREPGNRRRGRGRYQASTWHRAGWE